MLELFLDFTVCKKDIRPTESVSIHWQNEMQKAHLAYLHVSIHAFGGR